MLVLFLAFGLPIDAPTSITLHKWGDDGSNYWRIPAIVKTTDGTILTACDRRNDSNEDLANPIQIAIRRSTDDGKTFSTTKIIAGTGKDYGYSDPSLVVDKKSGAVLCVFNAGAKFQASTSSNRICQCYCISYDNGLTWSDPVDFTDQLYGDGCKDSIRKTWTGLFIVSGGGICLRSGRLMFICCIKKPNFGNYPVQGIWTDDLGRTWHIGGQPATIGDESQIVELNNGSLLMTVRAKPRKFVISNDQGESWSTPIVRSDMIDPNCNGGIIRYTSTLDGYDKNRILHTNQYHNSLRRNLTIKVSYDEGNTWKYTKPLDTELSAYSTMEIASDGSILVFYEKENSNVAYDMVLMRVSLEYITNGEDKYTPPKQ